MDNKKGLSNVYEHYIDKKGNKYFSTFSQYSGLFIRQVQTIDNNTIDASNGQPFTDIMLKLGFCRDNEKDLFFIHDNYHKFIFMVGGSNSGIENKPIRI